MLDNRSGSLAVTSKVNGDTVVVLPVGDIDLSGSPVLRQELKRVQTARPVRLVVDLSGVPYMDSSGVATLVEAMQSARKNKQKLILCCLTDRVRSIFEIARLEMVFTIVPDVNAAMAA